MGTGKHHGLGAAGAPAHRGAGESWGSLLAPRGDGGALLEVGTEVPGSTTQALG